MNKKLSKEAIDEIMTVLNEVKDVVKLMADFGIHITSDPWTATSFNDSENILSLCDSYYYYGQIFLFQYHLAKIPVLLFPI